MSLKFVFATFLLLSDPLLSCPTLVFATYIGVDFTKRFFNNWNLACLRKIYWSISPTNKTPIGALFWQISVNFINVKHTNFSYERRFDSFYYILVTREKLPKQHSYKKFLRLTLMKLTPGLPFAKHHSYHIWQGLWPT